MVKKLSDAIIELVNAQSMQNPFPDDMPDFDEHKAELVAQAAKEVDRIFERRPHLSLVTPAE